MKKTNELILKATKKRVVHNGKHFIIYQNESLMNNMFGDWKTYSETKPVYVSPFLEMESGEFAWHTFDKDFIGLTTFWADKYFLHENWQIFDQDFE